MSDAHGKKESHGGNSSSPLLRGALGFLIVGVAIFGLTQFDWSSIRNPFASNGGNSSTTRTVASPPVAQGGQTVAFAPVQLDPKVWDTSGAVPSVRPTVPPPFVIGANLDDTKPFAGDLTRKRWCQMCADLDREGRVEAGCDQSRCQ